MRKVCSIIWAYVTGYKNERVHLIDQRDRYNRELIVEKQNVLTTIESIKILDQEHAQQVQDLNNKIKDLKTKNELLQARLTVATSD